MSDSGTWVDKEGNSIAAREKQKKKRGGRGKKNLNVLVNFFNMFSLYLTEAVGSDSNSIKSFAHPVFC